MTLTDLAQGQSWMDAEERNTVAGLVQSFGQVFAERQIPENPFLVLRVEDVLLHHTLCRRLERNLPPNPDAVTPALAAAIGRARDRGRKALKELEDTAGYLAKENAAAPSGSSALPTPASPSVPVPGLHPQVPVEETPSLGAPETAANENTCPSHSSPDAHSAPPTASDPVPQANPRVPVSRPIPPHIFRHR